MVGGNNLFNLRARGRCALLVVASLIACHTSKAQFTIIDDLRGNNYPDIILGGPGGAGNAPDAAYFTSGIDDPVGSGWLRLTRDQTNQRGFAYIDRSFPSGMGVLVDFEYKMWRTSSGYNGADGLSVFLFDAEEDFRLGGYGGSLGYAPNTNSTPAVTEGLAGGYVGVGIDAYGNFSNPTEGRRGGPERRPNSIALRGPTTNDANATNQYLNGVTLDEITDEIDYNTPTAQRPSSELFYRRVQITIMSTGTGFYDITVRWSKAPGDVFTELITYRTTEEPPERMKVGFAASTGSDLNYHEIRNIIVTTLGNLRTVKLADRDYLIPANASGGEENKDITYTIEVVNDTDAPIENIVLRDTIKDTYGNVLTGGPEGTFEIKGIVVLDPEVWITQPNISFGPTNVLEGNLGIAANSTGRIRVMGVLHQTPPGNHIVNTVKLYVPEGTDQDLLNNISSVRTPVYAEGVDLILGDIIPDARCINYVDGNTFTVQVSNLGTDDVNVLANPITVKITFPGSVNFMPIGHAGWTIVSNDGASYEFLLDNPSQPTLARGFTHPDAIQFRLTPEITDTPTRSTYTVSAVVVQFNDEEGNNQENNTSEVTVQNCTVVSNPMIYHRVRWQ